MKKYLNSIYIADNVDDKRVRSLLKSSINKAVGKVRKFFAHNDYINIIAFNDPAYNKDVLMHAHAIDKNTILVELNTRFLKNKSDGNLKINFEAMIVHELIHCLSCQSKTYCLSRTIEDLIISEGKAVYLEVLLCEAFPSTLRNFKGKIDSHSKYAWKKFKPILKKNPANLMEFQYNSAWLKACYVLGFYIVNNFAKNRIDEISLNEFIKIPKSRFILFAKGLFKNT